MAKENKSNESSSSSHSEKASAPAPLPSPTDGSDSPGTAPSKSPPPPPPTPPSPPPSHSPPPAPSPSPPPPPTPSQAPPPHSSPPPPSSPPPSKGSPPPSSPSSPPPTPPSLPPPPTPPSLPPPPLPSPPSPTSPPPPNGNSPPPSQSHSPPPPPSIPTLPSPASPVTPPPSPIGSEPNHPPPPAGSVPNHPPPPTGSVPNHPPPLQSPPISPGSGSHSKPSAPLSNKSNPPSTSPSTSPPSRDNTGEYVGIALATFFVVAFIAAILFFVLRRRKKKRGNVYAIPPPKKSQMKGDVHYYVEEPGFTNSAQDGFYSAQHAGAMQHLRTPSDPAQQLSAGPMVFSYDKIAEITNGFSSENVIGEGGFGCVYKASMPDGRVGAVKLLKAGGGQGDREFRAEVEIISRVHHRHLVSLIGYCISEQQRVLIYEYVPNGNLNQHLHGSGWPLLDWPKRMKIAIGSARGLAYLHEGCNPKIIHRDIKSANILLDDAYEAQVADFGLARLTDDANTHVSTRVMGTFGYMAPEYATSGKLTDRSDVFSFGVVLLELITGRKPVDPTQPVGDESLVEWARPLLLRAIETGDFGELVDSRLEGQYVDSEMFRMVEAAAACVRHSAPKRPRMVQVARALDSGDQLYDLSNGVKYGHSRVYDSGQYNEDIMRFRRMANGSFDDSEFDTYSADYSLRETSGSKHGWVPHSSTGDCDSEIRAFQGPSSSADHRP